MTKVTLKAYTTPVDNDITPNEFIAYCARVSNPDNQRNHASAARLISYLLKHKHYSPFEMANMVVEIKTTRAISAQILRHRSFSFQEFSQRYATVSEMDSPTLRMSGTTNRQSSSKVAKQALQDVAEVAVAQAYVTYLKLVEAGVATETARGVLPMCTPTTLYMNGTVRSWIHYICLRAHPDTQAEHRTVALGALECLKQCYPEVAELITNFLNKD